MHSYLSNAKNRKVVDGRLKVFNAKHVLKLNKAIREIAQELLSVRITEESDALSQLRELRDIICFPYIFQTIMGKSAYWHKRRLSQKVNVRKNGREYTLLGKFTEDEVRQINDAIRVIALNLLSLELTTDYEKLSSLAAPVAIDAHEQGEVLSKDDADLLLYEAQIMDEIFGEGADS